MPFNDYNEQCVIINLWTCSGDGWFSCDNVVIGE
jgi:hypothetical protein